MKHIFIVNPVSGKGKNAKNYIPTIEKYIKEKNLDADIYVTSASRDGMRYVEEVAKKGEYMRKKIADFKNVKSVRGRGLMIGVEVDGKLGADVVKKCLENGLIALTAKTLVRLLPPLNISYDEIDSGLEILKKVIEE